MIIGHKADIDQERAVTTKEGRQFAEHHGVKFMETSAKSGQNVEEAFTALTKDIYELLETGQITPEEGWDGIKNGYGKPQETLSLEEGEESGGCC